MQSSVVLTTLVVSTIIPSNVEELRDTQMALSIVAFVNILFKVKKNTVFAVTHNTEPKEDNTRHF